MWVWDEVGNGDFCKVGILLSDNGNVCPEEGEGGEENGQGGASAMIAGQIQTSYGVMIDDVQVTASATGLSEYPVLDLTNDGGEYAFENNPVDFNYTITADKEDSYMSGVSTLDLVMMSRHIVGIASFEDPYQIIAADASADGRVSAVDLTVLKQLILGVSDELNNTSPWVFLDADQTFFDNTNPWPFTESIDIIGLTDNMMSEDFVGIKIGDVNESYQGAETRSSGLITLHADDRNMVAGEIATIDVSSDNFETVAGYQFTLNHEGLEFAGIDAGVLDIDESSVGVKKDMITMSWFNATTKTADKGEVLFTLTFEAVKDVELNSTLAINSAITKAEAYVGTDLDIYSIDIEFGTDVNEVSLFQNTPNPFETSTVIGFNLPIAAQATLTVYDLAGKEIKTIDGNFAKGYNTIVLESEDLNASGVLYYQLESGSFTATRKMIIVNK